VDPGIQFNAVIDGEGNAVNPEKKKKKKKKKKVESTEDEFIRHAEEVEEQERKLLEIEMKQK